VLDLSALKGVDVDPERRTARARPGALLGEFDRDTQAFGLGTPTGNVSKTGLAGLTLGGGLAWIARKHGPTCDNLIAADLVTAGGERVRAGAEENPDLLWGLRGGGGNFGVVTAFEYRLHEVGLQVVVSSTRSATPRSPRSWSTRRACRHRGRRSTSSTAAARSAVQAPTRPRSATAAPGSTSPSSRSRRTRPRAPRTWRGRAASSPRCSRTRRASTSTTSAPKVQSASVNQYIVARRP
jgi:FAD/FMN-containing dehydrogenase